MNIKSVEKPHKSGRPEAGMIPRVQKVEKEDGAD